MEFMDLPPRQKRLGTFVRHATILTTVVLTLLVFHLADDEVTGEAKLSDAYGFTLIFLLTGYFIGWLPEPWAKYKRTSIDAFLMPAFFILIITYLYFSFRTYFVQPTATGTTVFLQLFVMIWLLCRTD